jgi:hypothetical protein
MRTRSLAAVFVGLFLCVATARASGKSILHYVTLPLIEGAGIYASVATLADNGTSVNAQVSAGTNLAVLGTNAALGLVTAFSSDETREKMRRVHRIMGFVATAGALWLGVSSSIDGAPAATQAVSYGYAGLTVIPLVTFRF